MDNKKNNPIKSDNILLAKNKTIKIHKPLVFTQQIDINKNSLKEIQDKNDQKFDPISFIKNNSVKNTYDMIHIKKLIGKKIIILSKIIIVNDNIKKNTKIMKEYILNKDNYCSKKPKQIIMHAILSNGILNIIGGVSFYLAINTISYKDIEQHPHLNNIDIKIIQYPKITQTNIKKIIDYLSQN